MFDRVGRVDPVTRGLEIAVNYLGIQFDVCFVHFSAAVFHATKNGHMILICKQQGMECSIIQTQTLLVVI